MIKIKNLTMKNFLSIGAITQAVNFDQDQLTLILGENQDQGGAESISRNGAGKSSLVHAISFALYGQALTNIKKDNLINRINGKNMLVTLTFEKDNTSYRIERGRKPTILKFFINDQEQALDIDESQGDSRETQKFITDILGMNHLMFRNIICLNTYSEPFLSLKAADQRDIIENLLGISLLSEKAEKLKELIKETKDLITEENAQIEATKKSNDRIQQSINRLIDTQKQWHLNKNNECDALALKIDQMSTFDINTELKNHELIKYQTDVSTKISNLKSQIKILESSLVQSDNTVRKYENDIKTLLSKKCPLCEQGLHNDSHEILLTNTQTNLDNALVLMNDNATKLQSLYIQFDAENIEMIEVKTVYRTHQEALNHQTNLNVLINKLENKFSESDPYEHQINDLKNTALQTISWDTINELTRYKSHQDFVLKLLTNKDSFVRKKIIEQNLSYLNNRLSYYLDKIGLTHRVIFQNDLSVDIHYMGHSLDFHNLSRGEMTRLSISLSWAFRDVWENIYQNVNLLFIDEMLDNGMDSVGIESALNVLKHMMYERNKNVFLISHKDELTSKVNNVLKAVKTNGFTQYVTE